VDLLVLRLERIQTYDKRFQEEFQRIAASQLEIKQSSVRHGLAVAGTHVRHVRLKDGVTGL
jgi:hypothetical protein